MSTIKFGREGKLAGEGKLKKGAKWMEEGKIEEIERWEE